MSWSSRFGSWGGRFSPFGRNGTSYSDTRVTDKDYSYITPSDLAHEDSQALSGGETSHLAPRDTDVVTLKHKRESYQVHFPAYSIDKNELHIGEIRAQAARKLGVANPRRIKLLYRGRNMRDDASTARELGLRSNQPAEIMCVVGEALLDSGTGYDGVEVEREDDDVDMDADGDEATEDNDDEARDVPGAAAKRKRNRRGKKKGRKDRSSLDPASALGGDGGASMSNSANSSTLVPATPMDKLESIAAKFRTEFVPQCFAFTSAPPADSAKRQFEHKRLTEMILAQVLLKLDAVETEGDYERKRAKSDR